MRNQSFQLRHAQLITFLLLGSYWLLPGHYEPLAFAGAIVGPASLFALSILWLCCFGLPWRHSASSRQLAIIGALTAIFLATGLHHSVVAPADNRGLLASYHDNAVFAPPVEKSVPASGGAHTRIEPAIDFGSRGFSLTKQYFLLAFTNDTQRRTWTPGVSTDTDGYPFSVVLRGFLTAPADARDLWLETEGGSATLQVDGTVVAPATRHVIAAGTHAIEVRYARTEPAGPKLRLRWSTADGDEVVPASAFSHSESPPPLRLGNFALAAWIAAFAGLLLIARPRLAANARVGAWALFSVLLLHYTIELQREGRHFGFQVFEVGNDWLNYETLARAIGAGNWLASDGPLIFLNFAYRYLLAGLHFLAGEAPANAMLPQRAVMALAIAFAVHATSRLYGSRAAWILVILVIAGNRFRSFAEPLLDTAFAIAVSFVLLYALIRYARTNTRGWVIAAAVMLGAGLLVRANLLPLLGLGCLWIGWGNTQAGRRQKIADACLFVGIALAIGALLGLRNYIATGQWVFLPTNGLPNLWVGNHPPEFDGPSYYSAVQPPAHEILGRVIDYVLAEPWAFLQRVGEKALYILGIDRDNKLRIPILLSWLIAIAGSFSLFRQRHLRAELCLLWGFILMINLPLLLIFPWGYGGRLWAPAFLPLYIIDALVLAHWSRPLLRTFQARRAARPQTS